VRTALKVILIIGVCIVLLVAAGVGVGIYWWKYHSQEFIAASRQAMDEGREFGRQTDNEGCVTEAVARAKREPGFSAAISRNLFLRACLEASRPVPGFCSAVPAHTEFMKTAAWQQQKCREAGLAGDTYCTQLFTQVQQFCETKQSKQP
jgi:hypothetical protein